MTFLPGPTAIMFADVGNATCEINQRIFRKKSDKPIVKGRLC